MTTQYRLVDENGNDCEAQYISHFDQIAAGFKWMLDHLTDHYVTNGESVAEIYVLAANFNSLRKARFDEVEALSMLSIAMVELAKLKAVKKSTTTEGRN
jgi:hypothetical protein